MIKRTVQMQKERRSVAPAVQGGRPRLGMLLLGVVGGFALALLLFNAAPKLINNWRESRALTRADESLKRDDLPGAIAAAHEALQARPDSLHAFNILAEASERENLPETVAWRMRIAQLLPHEVDSQLNLASAALRFGQLEVARTALADVPPASRAQAAYDVVAGWLARAQGDEAGVEQHFAAAVEKEPANDLYQYNLAALRIKSPDPAKNAAARSTLERLARNPTYRAGSLRALLSDAVQRNDLGAADRVAQDLQMSPEVTFSDYLLCLDFYRKLDPKKFSALLEKVKPVAAREPADLALMFGWMNQNGMAPELLRWADKLPPEKTMNPLPAVEVAEALTTQKNWSRLRRWTRADAWGEYEYLRLGYQAYGARQNPQAAADTEFASLWRAAERACGDHPERQIRLARLASRWNLPTEAEQLWLRVAHNPLTRREALDALFEIYRSSNDLPNLYLTAMRLHETSPNEPIAAAEYARLSLLLGRDPSEGNRVAQEAWEQAPQEPLCAVTRALSLYLQGQTGEGLEILRKVPADQMHQPHYAAYAAVLLLDQMQMASAREFVEAARKGPLFPEEKELLEQKVEKTSALVAAAAVNTASSAVTLPSPSATPASAPSALSAQPSQSSLPSPPPIPEK